MVDAVAVLNDLIFSTKIVGTGRAMGIETLAVASADALDAALADGNVRLVIVDMDANGDTAVESIRRAKAHDSAPTTLAFYSHMRTDHATSATEAGATLAMPRSRFSAELPQLLGEYCPPISDRPPSPPPADS